MSECIYWSLHARMVSYRLSGFCVFITWDSLLFNKYLCQLYQGSMNSVCLWELIVKHPNPDRARSFRISQDNLLFWLDFFFHWISLRWCLSRPQLRSRLASVTFYQLPLPLPVVHASATKENIIAQLSHYASKYFNFLVNKEMFQRWNVYVLAWQWWLWWQLTFVRENEMKLYFSQSFPPRSLLWRVSKSVYGELERFFR